MSCLYMSFLCCFGLSVVMTVDAHSNPLKLAAHEQRKETATLDPDGLVEFVGETKEHGEVSVGANDGKASAQQVELRADGSFSNNSSHKNLVRRERKVQKHQSHTVQTIQLDKNATAAVSAGANDGKTFAQLFKLRKVGSMLRDQTRRGLVRREPKVQKQQAHTVQTIQLEKNATAAVPSKPSTPARLIRKQNRISDEGTTAREALPKGTDGTHADGSKSPPMRTPADLIGRIHTFWMAILGDRALGLMHSVAGKVSSWAAANKTTSDLHSWALSRAI